MAYVVAEPCIKCKYMDCVEICPVLCFHEGENMLVIDPEECINCDLCVAACPVEAIWKDRDLPDEWADFAQINAQYAQLWPVIELRGQAPNDCDAYKNIADKRHLLSPQAGRGTPG